MITLERPEVDALSDRVKHLRERARTSKSHVSVWKSHLFTQAWKENEGQPIDIRRARMIEKLLNELPVSIRDWELIVGSQSEYVMGSSPDLSYDSDLANGLESGKFTMRGETEVVGITEKESRSIAEDIEYWRGKSVYDLIHQRYRKILGDKKIDDVLKARVIQSPTQTLANGAIVDYPKVLHAGLRGIIREAEGEMSRLTFTHQDDMQKSDFLQAAIIAVQAVIGFARRHAALAREMAAKETDPARKHELSDIAEVCDRVPEHPAKSFREAIQSYWFIHLACDLETAIQPSRLDQELYPFYKQDLETGALTRNQAAELMACLWVKFNEVTQWQHEWFKEASQGTLYRYATIGGVTPDGKDATNELSYLILDVARQLKTPQPSLAVVWHPGMSEQFLMKAIETNRVTGGGIPAFFNGSSSTETLVAHGFSLEDARNIYISGCAHPHPSASTAKFIVQNPNAHKMFELALNNGVDPKTGKQLGPATGDPRTFHSFDQLMDAFKAQYTYFIDLLAKLGNIYLLTKMETCRVPLHSALMKDCIAKGRDVMNGGLRYNQEIATFNLRSAQNVANSMMAVKKLVFEQKKITMDELLKALSGNFEGQEELRQLLLAQPKWGNDDDEVDSLHAELWAWSAKVAKSSALHEWLDLPIIAHRGGATWHYLAGKTCGAFPDGRKAGQPFADANVSPMAGTDHKGPTAVINSASKLDHKASLDSLFNMKFPPHLLKSDENKLKLLALIKTYFGRGGYHIQFNMVSKDELLDAKAHPEAHRDLIVRVAGYSAYFVDLVPSVQDDIIARTEHVF